MNFLKKRKSLLDYNNRGINDRIDRPSSLAKGRESSLRQQTALRNSNVFPSQGQSRNLYGGNNSKSPSKVQVKRTRTLAGESVISRDNLHNYSSIDKAKKVKPGLPTTDVKRATPKHRLTESMKGSLFQIINANAKVRSSSKPSVTMNTVKSNKGLRNNYNSNVNSQMPTNRKTKTIV